MERHLLIAVSDDPKALHGVRFVANFLAGSANLKVTLFASLPPPPPASNASSPPVVPPSPLAPGDEVRSALLGRMESFDTALAKAQDILIRAGFAPSAVHVKRESTLQPTDFHLTLEGLLGMYDAVVLGRRGTDTLTSFFEESIAERLLRSETLLPCWACRAFEPEREGLLLCLDHSPSPNRMVEHVALMLGPEGGRKTTLLHVASPGGPVPDEGAVFNQATRLLLEGGFRPELVQTRVVRERVVARAILAEAEAGRFAVVGIGRRSETKGRISRLFLGSTGRRLLRELKGAALWFAG